MQTRLFSSESQGRLTLPASVSPAGGQGHMTFGADPATGIIQVQGVGFWTTDYVDAFFRGLEIFMGEHRRRCPDIRTLVDLRQSAPQALEVSRRIDHWTARIHRDSDRVALVVLSSLLKMQVKRTNVASITQIFGSPDEARAWLLAA